MMNTSDERMTDYMRTLAYAIKEEEAKQRVERYERNQQMQKLRDYVLEVIDTPIQIKDKGNSVTVWFKELTFEIDGNEEDWFRFDEISEAMEFIAKNAPKYQF